MKLAYFYAVIGIVLSLVIVSSFAQVPLQAQSGQNTLSIGKISLNFITKNGYESTPAVPEHWALSALPLSWFNSPPPSSIPYNLAFQNSSSAVNLNGGPKPDLGTYPDNPNKYYGSYGGDLILYDDYVYAFIDNVSSLYWTATPIWDYNNIDTGSGITWTSVGYSTSSGNNPTILETATLINNTVYLGVEYNNEPYILAANLGSDGTISSWTSYEIASSGGGAVEDILYANGEWYIGVGESSSALVYYGPSLSGPFSTYAPGSSYQSTQFYSNVALYGDLLGLVQTQNGDIVVGWFINDSAIAFAYYTPSTGSWSSVYTITAPSGYYDNEAGLESYDSNGAYLTTPIYGEQMTAVGNTVILDVLWLLPYDYENYIDYGSYAVNIPSDIYLYYYNIGASSPSEYTLTVSSWSPYAGSGSGPYGPSWTEILTEGTDVYLFAGTASGYIPGCFEVVYVSQGTSESWALLANIILTDKSYYTTSSSIDYDTTLLLDPWYVFANSTTVAVSMGSFGIKTSSEEETAPLAAEMYFNFPPSLSSYQISLSNIVPSGSFVQAYSGAPLNTINLTVTVYQGLSTSNLTQGASQTWTDVSSGSSLSWTTPWLQLQNPSTNSNGTYTNYYVVQFTVSALNAITKQPMNYTANVTLTNSLYWDTSLDVFNGSNLYITGGNMYPVLEMPFQAIMLLALLWSAIAYLIYRDIRMVEVD